MEEHSVNRKVVRMAIQKKVNPANGQYCPVCRSWQNHGRQLQHYEKQLDFVCDSCYKQYFQSITRLESINPAVEQRPADIRQGEYVLPAIQAEQCLRDALQWLLVTVCLTAALYFVHACFPADYFLGSPQFLNIPLLVCGGVSLLGTCCAGRQLVQGLLRGMDVKRRLCLAGKCVVFLIIGIVMLLMGMQ